MSKEKTITYHPDLAYALKGFVPVFANEDDRLIVLAISNLNVKIASIDNESFRMMEKNRETSKLTKKMKELQHEERSLKNRIISRNLDF